MPVPAKPDPDWSDSEDEDERSDVETSVLLGIPDGEIEKQEDVGDAAVSRIGGHPAFLTKNEPPFTSSQCKHCSFPMELLVQLWCPFENSPMDRALYIFGCARGECQQKAGSIRAFRGLRYNASYAAKLEKQLAKQREKEAARLEEKGLLDKKQAAAKSNPFSMNKGTGSSGGMFGASPAFGSGIGSQLFGGPAQESTSADSEPIDKVDDDDEAPPPESGSEPEDSEPESEPESDKSILAAPAHTPSSSSPWSAAPSYQPPFYLSTAAEYVPPAPKSKPPLSTSGALYDGDDENVVSGIGKSKKAEAKRAEKEREDAKAWNSAMEGYEDSLEVDKVFEKFARVAGYEGEQCIRYELGGTPLPYANDAVFKSLFPSPLTSTSAVSTIPARRSYDAKSSLVSPCPQCGGPRTFECQLMPHLIFVLNSPRSGASAHSTPSTNEQQDPEARKKELESLLRTSGSKSKDEEKAGEGKRSMEWGTCLVFSCANDCRVEEGKKEVNEVWAEELVLVQWDV